MEANTDTFLNDIWLAVCEGEIPSLFSLGCATVYFTLPIENKERASCIVGNRNKEIKNTQLLGYTGWARYCIGHISLWKMIQLWLLEEKSGKMRNNKQLQFSVRNVCKASIKKLKLPSIIKRKLNINEDWLPWKIRNDSHQKTHFVYSIKPWYIQWEHPEFMESDVIRSEQNIDCNYFDPPSYHPKCMNDMDKYNCLCAIEYWNCKCAICYELRQKEIETREDRKEWIELE